MLLSPWEFDAAEFEPGWRYELINGVLIVNAAPLRAERDPNEELGYWLRSYQAGHPQGKALNATLAEETVYIGPHRRRVDRAIWTGLGRLPGDRETPTITCEFVSAGRRNQKGDYETKRDEYRTAGVREYWIFDRFQHILTVYRFAQGKMTKKVLKQTLTYTTPLLPGFKMPLRRLFELSDRWSGQEDL
jgi:Uma2 family endonuclease